MNPLKLSTFEYKDTVEIPNNVVSKNNNFKPGINKKIVVTRIISNKAQLETRSFWTTQYVTEDKGCQYEDEFYNSYEHKKAQKISLQGKYSIIEQALCSNETVDIFKEDMEELGGSGSIETGKFSTSNLNRDVKTFHPSSDDGSGAKQEKDNQIYTVSSILWLPGNPDIFLIAYANGKSFDKKVESLGRSCTYKITFWSAFDQMNALYTIYTQNEITCMQFHPMDRRILMCGVNTGQVYLINLSNQFFEILDDRIHKKGNKLNQRDIPYEVKMSYIDKSHRTDVRSIEFVAGEYYMDKPHNVTKLMDNTDDNKMHRTFITMAEDGMLIFWDLKRVLNYEDTRELKLKTVSKWEPSFAIPFSRRNQSSDDLGGNQILVDIKESKVNKEKKLYVYCASNQGELCLIDHTLSKAEKIINNNIRDIDFYNHTDEFLIQYDNLMRNLRDTYCFERSPFNENLYMTVHDWNFVLWLFEFTEKVDSENSQDAIRALPIFISPNTDIMYSTGCFSKQKPNLVILGNIDGQVEIWDLHDQVNKYGFRTSLFDAAVVKLSISSESDSNWLAGGDEKGITRVVRLPAFLSYCADIEIEIKWLNEFLDTQQNKISDYTDSRYKKTKVKKATDTEEEKKKEEQDNEVWNIFSQGVKEYKTEFNMVLDTYEKSVMK